MRAIYTNDFLELQEWCEWYHKHSGILPQPLPQRFLIGQYQIYQAMQWHESKNIAVSWQECAAATLHFLMIAEVMKIPTETSIPWAYSDHTRLDSALPIVSWKEILVHLCGAAQMLIYSDVHSETSNRKSRYDIKRMTKHMSTLIQAMLALIPRKKRINAFYDEMCILTKDINIPV